LSLNYQPNVGVISIGIIKARNLKAKDINGLSGKSTQTRRQSLLSWHGGNCPKL